MTESEVIVVGAGPTGLALSLALARYGVPSLVLDNGDGEVTARAARTCVLRPDTAAWLPSAPGAAVPAARWTSWRARRRRQTVHQKELDETTAPFHVEQHALERALRAALAQEKLARVMPGSHLDILEQDAAGVTAHTRPRARDGGDGHGGGTWWRGSYLVGCDGARSTVRKLLGVPFAGRTAVERHAVAALRTRLPWESEALLDRDLDGGMREVTARPLPGGVWRLDWLLPARGDLVTPEALLERVHSTLAHWNRESGAGSSGKGAAGGDPDAGASGPYELLDTGVHTSHQRLARRWRVGRAFLAGDAAHLVGALGVQSVDEGLRDAANLAWKLAVVWHEMGGVRGPHVDRDAVDVVLDSYESERRGAVGSRLRAVDQALPLVRREGGGLRAILPGGGARTPLELLTDGHLGQGLLGSPAAYRSSPLAPARGTVDSVGVATQPGELVRDVPVIALDGERGRLRERLCGNGGELLVVLVAPGTGVWDSRHWLSAGIMPELAAAVGALPLKAELLVTEDYPGAAPHTVLVIRPDGHLVTALPAPRIAQLRACADALRGGPFTRARSPASRDARR